MKTIITSILIITTFSSYGQNELPKAFADLVEKTGLIFNQPKGWVETPVIKNPILNYDYALKYNDGSNVLICELRFAILPENKNSPKNEDQFIQNFNSIMSSVLTSPFKSSRDLFASFDNDEEMHISYTINEFNNHYTFKPEFAQQYTEGLIFYMYKKGIGQVYIFLLGATNDYCEADYGSIAFQTLMFKKK